MYNEIVKGELDAIRSEALPCIEGKDERVINERVSQALTGAGYPDILCLAIFQNWGIRIEGVIMNGIDMNGGPLLHFFYDWESGEFTTE